ncbi:MAG: hypothetical protein U1F25_16760 [Rubrivivax sp.]
MWPAVVQLKAGAGTADKAPTTSAIALSRSSPPSRRARRAEVKAQAEEAQQLASRLGYRDDQFDLSDALLAIAARDAGGDRAHGAWGLYWVALVPTLLNVLMSVASARVQIHPESIVKCCPELRHDGCPSRVCACKGLCGRGRGAYVRQFLAGAQNYHALELLACGRLASLTAFTPSNPVAASQLAGCA